MIYICCCLYNELGRAREWANQSRAYIEAWLCHWQLAVSVNRKFILLCSFFTLSITYSDDLVNYHTWDLQASSGVYSNSLDTKKRLNKWCKQTDDVTWSCSILSVLGPSWYWLFIACCCIAANDTASPLRSNF